VIRYSEIFLHSGSDSAPVLFTEQEVAFGVFGGIFVDLDVAACLRENQDLVVTVT
jgi:hypothetical protein